MGGWNEGWRWEGGVREEMGGWNEGQRWEGGMRKKVWIGGKR